MGCRALLQGIFPPQGSNPRLYVSCPGRQVLYHQHHKGSPKSTVHSFLKKELLWRMEGGCAWAPHRAEFKYQLFHFLAAWPRASHFPPLSLSPLFCEQACSQWSESQTLKKKKVNPLPPAAIPK